MNDQDKNQFEQKFKIITTSNKKINLQNEWANYIKHIDENMPDKKLISHDLIKLSFPECIFHAYLKSLISYDASKQWMCSNQNLRDIYNEYNGNPSHFSNHITYFGESYQIYGRGLDHGFKHRMAFTNFQRRFYDFLQENKIITYHPKRMRYTVPGHLSPILISIIMAWKYSPIAFPNNRGNKNVSFTRFQEKVFKKLGKFSFLSKEYKLFTLYFLHYFFNDEYYAVLQIPVFQRNKKVMLLLDNEYKNFTNALYKLSAEVPYLFLKAAYFNIAHYILENNIKSILTPETEYKPCPKFKPYLTGFYKGLKNLTEQNLTKAIAIMDDKLTKYSYGIDQFIIHIDSDSLEEYINMLTSDNSAYIAAIHKLCEQLKKQFKTCQNNLEFRKYEAANIIKAEKDIKKFLSETNSLLSDAVQKHKKSLAHSISSVDKYEKNNSYQLPKSLSTIDLLYENTFRMIIENIGKLEQLFEKVPPIELKKSNYEEMHYENLTTELSITVAFYNDLFLSFEDRMKTKLDSPDLFFQAFQSYLKDHGINILSALLSDKEIKNALE